MISNSRIYRSEVLHHRLEPVSHRFRYNTCIYGFDLDEIAQLSERLGWLGHNQNRLVSFHDIDHLSGTNQPLREQLTEILAREAYSAPIGQIILVTGARFLGHVFNPASFWFCYSPEGELAVVVAEVNNTFGERHAYILKDPLPAPDGYLAHYRVPKAFYVSPFNAVAGDYDFLLADPRERLDIRLRVYDRENCVFDSWLRGPGEVLQGKTLGAVLLDYPL